MRFLVCIFLTQSICFYSNIPPEKSTYNDTRPRLVLNLTGFNAGSRVYVRYWESDTAYAYPDSYPLYIDVSGRLLTEIVLKKNVKKADVLVYVDQSGDGILSSADFGTFIEGIAVNIPANGGNVYTNLDIKYSTATLSSYNPAVALPGSGQIVCVYMPTSKGAWAPALQSSIPDLPELTNATLSLSDWFPYSTVSTTSFTQSAALISSLGVGGFMETCVRDINSNGTYDSGETVSASAAVP